MFSLEEEGHFSTAKAEKVQNEKLLNLLPAPLGSLFQVKSFWIRQKVFAFGN